MIPVKRPGDSAPVDLDGQDCAGVKELIRALRYHSDPANVEESFEYKAYKLGTVVAALTELFHGKCAYCESPYRATQPVDVEHFRPKGAVAVFNRKKRAWELRRPGYYWLAAYWHNLLPACIDCNRERTQEFPDDGPGLAGKGNKFPLADERRRAKPFTAARLRRLLLLERAALLRAIDEACEQLESQESPLLLNPCRDDPDQHLEFTEDGVVRPALAPGQSLSPKGQASIEIFGLTRKGLCQARRDWAVMIRAQIQRVKDEERNVEEYPDNPRFERGLKNEMLILIRYLDDDRPYAGMARQLIRKLYRPIPRP